MCLLYEIGLEFTNSLVHILQVSPELYGDNYPRFFTYWTVSIMTTFVKTHTHIYRGGF